MGRQIRRSRRCDRPVLDSELIRAFSSPRKQDRPVHNGQNAGWGHRSERSAPIASAVVPWRPRTRNAKHPCWCGSGRGPADTECLGAIAEWVTGDQVRAVPGGDEPRFAPVQRAAAASPGPPRRARAFCWISVRSRPGPATCAGDDSGRRPLLLAIRRAAMRALGRLATARKRLHRLPRRDRFPVRKHPDSPSCLGPSSFPSGTGACTSIMDSTPRRGPSRRAPNGRLRWDASKSRGSVHGNFWQ